MKPLVSVIIPVYNGASFLAEAIKSAVDQDYSPMEIIVADDGSTDDSVAIARSFPEVTLLKLEHQGVSATRNAAVAASRGEFLAFLDADDFWLAGKIASQVTRALQPPEPDIVLCQRWHQFDEVPAWYIWPTSPQIAKMCFEPTAWLVRRTSFDEVGGFEHGRALGEDTNWLMRAWSMGKQHRFVHEPLIVRRIHGANASAQLPSAEKQRMTNLRESIAIKRALKAAEDAAARDLAESKAGRA